MVEGRFDALTRFLASAVERRALAATVAGIAVGGLPGKEMAGRRRKRCSHDGKPCGKGSGKKGRACKRCCSKFSIFISPGSVPSGKRHCACRSEGMGCTSDAQCCNGVCNTTSGVCDDGEPSEPPVVCNSSVNFCQTPEQNCGSTTKCYCVTTNSDEMFCTNGNFNCFSSFGNGVTCNTDNDCFDEYGEGWACLSTSDCPSSVPCSGSGGTVCAQICGL